MVPFGYGQWFLEFEACRQFRQVYSEEQLLRAYKSGRDARSVARDNDLIAREG